MSKRDTRLMNRLMKSDYKHYVFSDWLFYFGESRDRYFDQVYRTTPNRCRSTGNILVAHSVTSEYQWRAHALHNDCVTLTNVDSRQLLVIGKYLIYIFVVCHTPWIKVLSEEIPARDLKFAWLALKPDTVATAREINKYTLTKQNSHTN